MYPLTVKFQRRHTCTCTVALCDNAVTPFETSRKKSKGKNPLLQNPLATGYATGRFLHAVLEYTTGQNKIGEGEKPWQVEQAQHKLDRKICAWLSSFFYCFCFLFVCFSTYTSVPREPVHGLQALS